MSLIVENLSVSRGSIPVLHDISMTCQPGEAVVLRGPNGVGKTTFLRTLAGFIPPSAGTASLNGATLKARDDFQSHLTYAGHADAIKAQLTVAENIQFWADLHQNSGASDALAAFDLLSIQDRLAGRCSAGQKRRLGLARLLVAGRSLWLLDEPTVSLDTASKDALATQIKTHLNDGGLAVIATHDADLVDGKTLTMTPPPAYQPDQNRSEDGYFSGEAAP